MCNASIPPRLPHPGVCKPVGFPRLLIEQEGGQLSSFIQHFFFFFFLLHWQLHTETAIGRLSSLHSTNKPDTFISGDFLWRRRARMTSWALRHWCRRSDAAAWSEMFHSGLICSSSFNPNLQTKGMKQLLLNYLAALHVCLRKERQKAPHVLFSSILGHWLQL